MFVPNKGDRVRVRGFVLDREYRAEGIVERVRWDRIRQEYLLLVDGHWWAAINDIENRFDVIAPSDARCRSCGETGVEMKPVSVRIAYDEDGHEDEAGCFVEHHTEWRCANRATCEQNRRKMWKLQQDIARWADMEAREEGRGGRIGGGF